HHLRRRGPAAREEAAVRPALRRLGVGVKGLRIVARRERDDLVRVDLHAAELGAASDRVVLEITGHAGASTARPAGRPAAAAADPYRRKSRAALGAGERNRAAAAGYWNEQMPQVIEQAFGKRATRRGSPATEGATIDNRQ